MKSATQPKSETSDAAAIHAKSPLDAALQLSQQEGEKKQPAKTQDAAPKEEAKKGSTGEAGKVAPARAVPPCSPNRIKLTGYLHNDWDVTPPRGTEVDDLKNPDWWKHIASSFKPHDHIEAICEDGSWYARFLVVSCDRTWANVHLLEHHDLAAAKFKTRNSEFEDYKVEWTTLGQWTIIKKGNEGMPPLKDGFTTRIDALTWLDEHLRTRG